VERLPIYLRAHTVADGAKAGSGRRKPQERFARYALVFDSETTVDTTQALTFGFYRFCERRPGGN
jgi:hypothetical protein